MKEKNQLILRTMIQTAVMLECSIARLLDCSIIHYSFFIFHFSFFSSRQSPVPSPRIRAEPRKPAKEKADVMQGEKERTCELLFRPCSHTAYDCGLEGGDRRQQGWPVR